MKDCKISPSFNVFIRIVRRSSRIGLRLIKLPLNPTMLGGGRHNPLSTTKATILTIRPSVGGY